MGKKDNKSWLEHLREVFGVEPMLDTTPKPIKNGSAKKGEAPVLNISTDNKEEGEPIELNSPVKQSLPKYSEKKLAILTKKASNVNKPMELGSGQDQYIIEKEKLPKREIKTVSENGKMTDDTEKQYNLRSQEVKTIASKNKNVQKTSQVIAQEDEKPDYLIEKKHGVWNYIGIAGAAVIAFFLGLGIGGGLSNRESVDIDGITKQVYERFEKGFRQEYGSKIGQIESINNKIGGLETKFNQVDAIIDANKKLTENLVDAQGKIPDLVQNRVSEEIKKYTVSDGKLPSGASADLIARLNNIDKKYSDMIKQTDEKIDQLTIQLLSSYQVKTVMDINYNLDSVVDKDIVYDPHANTVTRDGKKYEDPKVCGTFFDKDGNILGYGSDFAQKVIELIADPDNLDRVPPLGSYANVKSVMDLAVARGTIKPGIGERISQLNDIITDRLSIVCNGYNN